MVIKKLYNDKNKVLIALSVGNILEFYDFALYGLLAPKIAILFFPNNSDLISLILTFSIFTIGFIARPFGALLFGYIGDRYGRSLSLSYSLLLMGIITCLIGILPTYNEIGILAPLFLCILRILQGICMGGEFSGSLILVSELLSNKKHKALYTSVCSAAGVSGWLLAAFIVFISNQFNYISYSWRLPFILSGSTAFVGYFIRQSLNNTEKVLSNLKTKQYNKFSITSLLSQSILPFLIMVCIGGCMGIIFYGQFIFQNTFLTSILKVNTNLALLAIMIGISSYMVFLPIFGWLSDKIGHSNTMMFSAISIMLLSYPIYNCFITKDYIKIILAEVLSGAILALFMGPATYVMTTLFHIRMRYTGVSFGYNVGASLFGGITPTISMLLYQLNLNPMDPFLYLAFAGVLGIFGTYLYQKLGNNLTN
ncbi:MFS transporter [Candidatus Jidaibacter acanthamoebae]|nr:MFS transporter [Candidatus Jidaibacter acanthamoeba]